MNADMILKADLIDLVFEHRNKEYGAYVLRREYNRHLMIGIAGPILLVLLAWWLVGNKVERSIADILPKFTDTTTVTISPPPVMPEPLKRLSLKHSATVEATTPVITRNVEHTDMPEVSDLMSNDAVIGTVTDDPPGPAPEAGPPVAPTAPGPVEPAILAVAEVMPEFPGGMQAFSRFMGKNLRVPDEVSEPGTLVKVRVNFVVNKDGLLESVQFNDSVALAYQREIRRVFQKMPRWNPGSQHGKSVSVYYHIPIVFEIPDERAHIY